MKNLLKGIDDLYYTVNITDSNNEPLIPATDLQAFSMGLYTSNDGPIVTYDKTDLIDSVLHVSAQDLVSIPDGPLKIRFIISIQDDNYSDGNYTVSADRLSGYFLKTPKQTQPAPPVDASVNENDTQEG